MKARALVLLAFVGAACSRGEPNIAADPTTPKSTPSPTPEAGAPTPMEAATCMSDEHLYGTTCCHREDPNPGGMLECRGPQIGKPCNKRGDCDVICECDAQSDAGSPWSDQECGACNSAHCGGFIPDGVWICIRDESGKVTSLIVN